MAHKDNSKHAITYPVRALLRKRMLEARNPPEMSSDPGET
jgi:hypothetical protein